MVLLTAVKVYSRTTTSFGADMDVPVAVAGASNLQATWSFAILRHLSLILGFQETVVSVLT